MAPVEPMNTATHEKRWKLDHIRTDEAYDPMSDQTLVRLGLFLVDERGALMPTGHLLTIRKNGLSRAELASALMDLAALVEAGK
jgi:hypothetical protein